jgi:hypothetical protein
LFTSASVSNTAGVSGGVGRGAVRLYAEAGGEPGGYTWSTGPRSPLHRITARPLALGRPA